MGPISSARILSVLKSFGLWAKQRFTFYNVFSTWTAHIDVLRRKSKRIEKLQWALERTLIPDKADPKQKFIRWSGSVSRSNLAHEA